MNFPYGHGSEQKCRKKHLSCHHSSVSMSNETRTVNRSKVPETPEEERMRRFMSERETRWGYSKAYKIKVGYKKVNCAFWIREQCHQTCREHISPHHAARTPERTVQASRGPFQSVSKTWQQHIVLCFSLQGKPQVIVSANALANGH